MKSGMNLQDSFLNQVRREGAEVKILLVNGTLLRGAVKGFDNFTVIVGSRNGQQNLVYKHAIAQVTSQRAARHDDDAAEDSPAEPKPVEETIAPPAAVTPVAVEAESKPEAKPALARKETFNALDLSKIRLADVAAPEAKAK